MIYVGIVGNMSSKRITAKERLNLYIKNTILLLLIAALIYYFKPDRLTIEFSVIIGLYISFVIWSYWIIYYRKEIDNLEIKPKVEIPLNETEDKNINLKQQELEEDKIIQNVSYSVEKDKTDHFESNDIIPNTLKDKEWNIDKKPKQEPTYESTNIKDSSQDTDYDSFKNIAFLKWCDNKKLFLNEGDYPSEFTENILKSPQKQHREFINEGLLILNKPTEELNKLTVNDLKNILRHYNKRVTHKNKAETIKYILENIQSDLIYDYYKFEKIYVISPAGKEFCKL